MKNGPYELIIPPDDYPGTRYRGRYAYEHRVNWWRKTGKNPDNYAGHLIHHLNETKRDNGPGNLELKELAAHTRLHARPAVMRSYVCLHCGAGFERRANGHPQKFCSRQCIGFYNHRRRKYQS